MDKALIDGLADDDLLWVDVDSSQEGAVARVTALIPVHIESMSVTDANRPFVHGFGESFVLGVLPLPVDMAQPDSEMLICAVGRNWLVTVHDGEAGALKGFADHLRGDSVLGRLDAPSFLARLLEWVVNAYLDYLDEVHDVIDGLEGHPSRPAGDDVVGRLVEFRHDLGRLRRRLFRIARCSRRFLTRASTSSRAALRRGSSRSSPTGWRWPSRPFTRPARWWSGRSTSSRRRPRSAPTTRSACSRSVSLALLPVAAIAGILGMDMVPQALRHTWVFWAALALMVVISAAVLVTMRRLRHWL